MITDIDSISISLTDILICRQTKHDMIEQTPAFAELGTAKPELVHISIFDIVSFSISITDIAITSI